MVSTAAPPESSAAELGLGGDPVLVEKEDALEAPSASPEPLPSADAAVSAPLVGAPAVSGEISAGPEMPAPKPVEVELDLTQVSVAAAELSKGVVDLASSAGNQAAAAVQELSKINGLTEIGTKLSSWWSTFDPLGEKSFLEQLESEPERSDVADTKPVVAKSGAVSAQTPAEKLAGYNLQALFELPASESLIETFPCQLLQTFMCSHNNFIPDFQRSYPGRLFITEQHVCFQVEDKERRVPEALETMSVCAIVAPQTIDPFVGKDQIVLGHSAIKSVGRQKVRRGARDALKLGLGPDQWVRVKSTLRKLHLIHCRKKAMDAQCERTRRMEKGM